MAKRKYKYRPYRTRKQEQSRRIRNIALTLIIIIVGGVMLTTMGGVNMLQGGVTHVGALGLCSVAGGKTDVVGGQTSIKGAPIKLN